MRPKQNIFVKKTACEFSLNDIPARQMRTSLVTMPILPSVLLILTIFLVVSAEDLDLPPIRTEVRYTKDKEVKEDDPNQAWEEWGETDQSRKNPFPRRQREIKVGMDINAIMGMAMRQPKVVTAVLTPEFGSSEQIGQMVTQKFRNQMAAAGIGCRLWFVSQGRQVVANCETIRDGHMAKDYMILQREIMRTVIDNVPFTPKPTPDDDDDDEDDGDDDAGKYKGADSVKNQPGGGKEDL